MLTMERHADLEILNAALALALAGTLTAQDDVTDELRETAIGHLAFKLSVSPEHVRHWRMTGRLPGAVREQLVRMLADLGR